MKILLTLIFFACGFTIFAQPGKVKLEGCVNSVFDGTYTQKNGALENGCPCYEHDASNRVLYLRYDFLSMEYNWLVTLTSDGTCNTIDILTGNVISVSLSTPECDVTQVEIVSGETCVITEIQEPIPTLSQWGLIILGLCLSIFGIIAVRQRIFAPV